MARDVQNMESEAKFRLSRVGITGVKKPVLVRRSGKAVSRNVLLDLFVDLPAHQRGSHLSRNAEAINALVEEAVHNPAGSLEGLCGRLARDLLERHPYAKVAEVHASADYFLERKNASGRRSLEPFKLLARTEAQRNGRLQGPFRRCPRSRTTSATRRPSSSRSPRATRSRPTN